MIALPLAAGGGGGAAFASEAPELATMPDVVGVGLAVAGCCGVGAIRVVAGAPKGAVVAWGAAGSVAEGAAVAVCG